MFDSRDIDIVAVTTPNHWHALASVWAIQAGKDVYVEKPVSHTVREGRKIVDAARAHNRIVQAGSQHRSSPLVRSAIEFIHGGGIGKLYMAKCPYTAIGGASAAEVRCVFPGRRFRQVAWLVGAALHQQPFHYKLAISLIPATANRPMVPCD